MDLDAQSVNYGKTARISAELATTGRLAVPNPFDTGSRFEFDWTESLDRGIKR
jgi:hypothetical protein